MNGRRLLLGIGVLAFVVIISIAIFSINWGGNTPTADPTKDVNIADYASTATQVRMTVRGPVNSDQQHEELEITVGRDLAIGKLIAGYQGNTARTEQTSSNTQAYKTFLSALHNAAFTKKQTPAKGLQYDGACAKAKRYTFEFLNGGSDAPESLWATTCSKKDGNFGGNLILVKNLFNAQIPEEQFKALTENSEF